MPKITGAQKQGRLLRLLGFGLVMGGVIAACGVLLRPSSLAGRGTSLSPTGFRKAAESDEPVLRHVIVYPPTRNAEGTPVQFITGELVTHHRGKEADIDFTFFADVPFDYGEPITPPHTVREYLNGVDRPGSPVPFRYAWWADHAFIVTASLFGSLLFSLGVIPALAGAVRALRPEAVPEAPEEKPETRFAPHTEEEPEQPVPEPVAAASPPAAPLPPAEPLPEFHEDEENKDYAGEFYPVARPLHHTDPPQSPPTNVKPK